MKPSDLGPKTFRKRYDKAFRQQAVELWQASPNKTGAQVAAELGVPVKRLYHWRACLNAAPPPPAANALAPEDLARENAALRQEVALLRQQRDILKKTLGILSEPPQNVTNALKP
jgi:transposase-like protein